jgi:cystathionine gamma-synthase/cystathionine gamma-lyase/cystathionine beta-lyase
MSAFDTRALHDGEPVPRIEGAVSLPIFQTATYTHKADEPLRYVRLNNSPNHEALHDKLASLTETEQALVTASGMAAISSTLLSLLEAGDHLVAPKTLYGGTLDLFDTILPRFGIDHSVLPKGKPAAWREALTDDTTVLYAESITNPMLEVPDLEAMASFADKHDLVSVIDNTFASPVNLRPATLGFDVVLHSATKYLGGHSDVAAGVVAGPSSLLDEVAHTLTLTGGMLDPHACFLLHRSLKTLGVRMRKHNATAGTIAAALAEHKAVDRVHYPGHPSHPHHDRAQALFDGYGGMVSFTLGAGADPETFFDHLTLPIRAPSLGGVESLVTQPAHTSHRDLDPDERQALGITERLIRLSVGLEDPDDLVADLTGALDASRSISG